MANAIIEKSLGSEPPFFLWDSNIGKWLKRMSFYTFCTKNYYKWLTLWPVFFCPLLFLPCLFFRVPTFHCSQAIPLLLFPSWRFSSSIWADLYVRTYSVTDINVFIWLTYIIYIIWLTYGLDYVDVILV